MGDDVLVVGGGVVGAALAEELARRGARVSVLDRGEPGGGTSVRSFGLVDVLEPLPPAVLRLRSQAVAETAAWVQAHDLGARVAWDPCGSVTPVRGAGEARALQAALPAFAAAGVRAAWWSRAELAAHEPHLAPDLLGGLHLPDDACLDPVAYVAALQAAARGAGVRWEQADVRTLRARGGGWDAVLADGRAFRARRAVIAAGVWSPTLLPGLPVRPVRGTVLTTEPGPRLLRHYTPILRQLPDGRCWIGGSQEDAGYALDPDPTVVARLRAAAIAQLPALEGLAVTAVRTGLRPMPPGGLPLAGPWPGAQGLFVAVTHSGITLARWLGSRLARWLLGEPVPECLPFAPGA